MADKFDYPSYLKQQHHHESDWKQQRYLDTLVKPGEKISQADKPVTLALFGVGRMGLLHLQNILANRSIDLKYIVEGNKAIWEPTIAKLNIKGVTFLTPQEANRVYEDKDIEAVMVVTPTPTHESVITAALKAKKAVCTEKPVCDTREGIARVYELASGLNLPLMCAFNRRFDPSMRSMQEAVRSGKVGRILQISITSRDCPSAPLAYLPTSGGVYSDCTIHDIDLMIYMMAQLPTEVYANATSFVPEIEAMGDYDNLITTFKFKTGAVGVITNCRVCPFGQDQRAEVFGTKGMLQVENEAPNQSVRFTEEGVSRPPIMHSCQSRYVQGYYNEVDHFVKVVRGKEELMITGKMVKAVAKIVDACNESLRKKAPVSISWTKEEIPTNFE